MCIENEILAVDIDNQPLFTLSKEEAHKKGILHRAFSVILYNGRSILLQKRASDKYHCGGLWTNTCCSHPYPKEDVGEAAKRRMQEEMGIADVLVEIVDSILYFYKFDNGLMEYEYDHILVGEYKGDVNVNPEEVEDTMWIDIDKLKEWLMKEPQIFTPWFIIMFPKVYDVLDRISKERQL